jgi:DNA-binding transcriptional LysR family regulator
MDYLSAMRAFVRSVDLGSFSKAADEMDVKISTVSRHISGLEADLGVALLNRSTRRLHLTEAGVTFYDRAVVVLADVEDARSAASAFNRRPMGLLRVSLPPTFGRLHVMPHLKDFYALYPDIRLDLSLSETTVDMIEAGLDVAIRIGALPDSSLMARRLASNQRRVVASPDYIARNGEPGRPADLADHRCLAFALQARNDAWFYRPSGGASEPLVAVTISGGLRVNNSEALLQAARDGLGIALLPTYLITEDLRAGRLTPLLTQHRWFISPGSEPAIYFVYPPKKTVSTKVRAFLDFFASRFRDPPYWEAPVSETKNP